MDESVTHEVLRERIDNLKVDVAEIKESVRYLSRTIVALIVSLLLIGTGGLLTFLITQAGSATGGP